MASERQPPASPDRKQDPVLLSSEIPGVAIGDRITRLDGRSGRILCILAAFLENSRAPLSGQVCQDHFTLCLQDGIGTEDDLWLWLQERLKHSRLRRSSFDAACRSASETLEKGWWVASMEGGLPPLGGTVHCPRFVLGRGSEVLNAPGFAWLNSRKPRRVDPDVLWLRALRGTLAEIASLPATLVASSGTLTYNLVSAFALEESRPLLRILPDLQGFEGLSGGRGRSPASCAFITDLTCQFAKLRCPKALRWTCRDRLLAYLADVHIVLELRASSGLVPILSEQHRLSPRALWMLAPGPENDRQHSGNRELTDRLPAPPRLFHAPAAGAPPAGRAAAAQQSPVLLCSPESVVWGDYLFHYTRSCHGPWPGEDLQAYCLSLLRGDPLSPHTALATLARMLNEGRIRASRNLVRGRRAVVSLTSRPPQELDRFRRWNRSLARWTLEPCGMAIKKATLKKLGARPTIYGDETVYRRLRPRDCYRFQSTGRRASWAAEREWRLDGDLWLLRIPLEDWIAFVPCRGDTERLARLITAPIRCIALENP